MKKIFLLLGMVASIMFLVTGCAYKEAADNLHKTNQLRINMTQEQVKAIMGEPIKDQEYAQPNVWYYYTSPQWIDGYTTEDECIPLVFKKGKLAGWGWNYFEKYRIQHKFAK